MVVESIRSAAVCAIVLGLSPGSARSLRAFYQLRVSAVREGSLLSPFLNFLKRIIVAGTRSNTAKSGENPAEANRDAQGCIPGVWKDAWRS